MCGHGGNGGGGGRSGAYRAAAASSAETTTSVVPIPIDDVTPLETTPIETTPDDQITSPTARPADLHFVFSPSHLVIQSGTIATISYTVTNDGDGPGRIVEPGCLIDGVVADGTSVSWPRPVQQRAYCTSARYETIAPHSSTTITPPLLYVLDGPCMRLQGSTAPCGRRDLAGGGPSPWGNSIVVGANTTVTLVMDLSGTTDFMPPGPDNSPLAPGTYHYWGPGGMSLTLTVTA